MCERKSVLQFGSCRQGSGALCDPYKAIMGHILTIWCSGRSLYNILHHDVDSLTTSVELKKLIRGAESLNCAKYSMFLWYFCVVYTVGFNQVRHISRSFELG